MRALLLAALLAIPGVAADNAASHSSPNSLRGLGVVQPGDIVSPGRLPAAALKTPTAQSSYRVSFSLRVKELTETGSFIVGEGSQSNYVAGGEIPRQVKGSSGKGVEYKKWAAVINCLAAARGSDAVAAEIQVELSGPVNPPDAKKSGGEPALETLQYQGSFTAALGQTVVLVDDPSRRVEVTVTRAD